MNLSNSPRLTTDEFQLLGVILTVVAFIALAGCGSRPKTPEPIPPAPTQVVKVAVPVPCEVEQVAPKSRPQASKGMGIFDLSKIALADRRVLIAENSELRAANANPCPERR